MLVDAQHDAENPFAFFYVLLHIAKKNSSRPLVKIYASFVRGEIHRPLRAITEVEYTFVFGWKPSVHSSTLSMSIFIFYSTIEFYMWI